MWRMTCVWMFMLMACLSSHSAAASSSSASSSPNLGLRPTKLNPVEITSKDTENGRFRFQKLPQQQRQRHRLGLQLHFKKIVSFLKNPKFTSVLASSIQYGIIAYLLVEGFQAVKDVYQELQEEQELGGSGNSNALLSPMATKKLLVWLQLPRDERGPPPSISPSWMIPLANDLIACDGVSGEDLQRILLQMTNSQAILLQSSLLRPTRRMSFEAIGGLSAIKQTIEDWIASNCQPSHGRTPTPYDQFVGQGRQGMVLWGPPGCGKSLLMQALAKKSGWPTLVVTPSLIQRKYYGDSTNQVRSLFGLVALLGPCIVVLDELDGLFRVRSQDEHEASRELKTEWLQWWDGVASSQLSSNRVFVVAATNRPWDVDPAVWRRLPQRFYVGAPTWDDRCDLVGRWTQAYQLPPIHPTVVEHLAESTEGYTPSDLYQILQFACRTGPMARQDFQLTMEDVQQALNEVPPTRYSFQYIQQLQGFLAPHLSQQQQQTSQASYSVDNPSCWETPMGNFYQFNMPVDSQVLDVLEELWSKQHDWESSDDEEYEEESEDDAY